jgi:hypothetical protein
MKHWAKEYDSCTICGTTEKRHKGKGKCTACYYREYKRNQLARRSDNLERFVRALPTLLREQLGVFGITARCDNGQVTLGKVGTKNKVTWPD